MNAIVAIGYNRPNSLKRLLDNLVNSYYCEDVDLIVSIDKGNNQVYVLEVLDGFVWPHGKLIINVEKERLGLRKHILKCGDYTEIYDAIIMFEDDILPSKFFYNFVKKAISFYNDKSEVAGISLYAPKENEMAELPFEPTTSNFDVYFIQSASSWGQCWTKRMWEEFKTWYINNNKKLEKSDDLPKKIYEWPESSWKKYFMKYLVVKNKYFVYPYISLSTNFTDLGQHVNSKSSRYQVPLLMKKMDYNLPTLSEGVTYDAFYEFNLNEINDYKNICIDLYGLKENYQKYDYLLTRKNLNFKIIKKYGSEMKPHESNIFFNIEGIDIFLYDLNEKVDKKNILTTKWILNKYNVSKYYTNLNWKNSLLLGIFGLFNMILLRIKKIGVLLKWKIN